MLVTPKNGTACFTFMFITVSSGIVTFPPHHGSLRKVLTVQKTPMDSIPAVSITI
jgi:hypothetical protein